MAKCSSLTPHQAAKGQTHNLPVAFDDIVGIPSYRTLEVLSISAFLERYAARSSRHSTLVKLAGSFSASMLPKIAVIGGKPNAIWEPVLVGEIIFISQNPVGQFAECQLVLQEAIASLAWEFMIAGGALLPGNA